MSTLKRDLKKWSFLFLIATLASVVLNASSKQRILAIGDVHGAYEAFDNILKKTQIVNEKQQWIGEKTILVQTGDVLDRGPESRRVMDYLMMLEKQAPSKSSRVVALLGNHEVMNMIGDLRYVSSEEYASYTDSNSAKKQQAAYSAYSDFLEKRAKKLELSSPSITKEKEDEWKQKHPLGFVEHREAFSRTGKYGKWLRKLDGITVIDGIAFLHGGISLQLKDLTPEEMNRKIHQELKLFDSCREYLQQQKAILPFFTLDEILDVAREELAVLQKRKAGSESTESNLLQECVGLDNWMIIHPEGPLWFRGFANWDETEGSANLATVMEKFKVSHFVTGHSVQPGGQIRSRFGGKIFLIDTGMLSNQYPGGRASALEILGGKFIAIYPDKKVEF